MKRLRVALVNDWLVHVRGQERVFQALCDAFPTADIYTLVYNSDRMPRIYEERGVRTSFVQHLPAARHKFRAYLPLYPLAARSIDLSGYDLVIASSSAFIHGVTVGDGTILVCYCHSPFRYVWSHWDVLVGSRARRLTGLLLVARSLLRRWDLIAASRVNQFIAPSKFVAQRISAIYGRESTIIPPPVDLNVFRPSPAGTKDYYLVVSPLMRWKRVDIAIDAFNRLRLPLKVVGDGEEISRLRAMARNNIEFLGARTHEQVADLVQLYGGCRALVMTSEEDFGMAPLEAMACGRPVIAYRGGGAVETVSDGVTGRLFDGQSPDALAHAIRTTNCETFDPEVIRRKAEEWDVNTFKAKVISEIERGTDGINSGPTSTERSRHR